MFRFLGLVALPVYVSGEGQHSLTVGGPDLHPPLEPRSDRKFFKKDYPNDLRPSIDAGKWQSPYPKLQSNAKFDADYVKDENGDGGHWKAQMKYDSLKMKFAKQKEGVKKALAKEQEELREYENTKGPAKDAEAKATAAEAAAKAAQAEADAAAKELKEAIKAGKDSESTAAAAHNQTKKPTTVAEAEKRLDAAVEGMKDCEKRLEDARKQLEEMKAKAARDKDSDVKTKDKEVEKAKTVEKEKGGSVKSKEDALAAAKAKAAAAEKEAKKARKDLEEEKKEHDEADEEYKHEKVDMVKLEKDYEAAEAELRRLRGETSVPGQVKKEPTDHHSASFKSSVFVPFVAAFVVCMAASA